MRSWWPGGVEGEPPSLSRNIIPWPGSGRDTRARAGVLRAPTGLDSLTARATHRMRSGHPRAGRQQGPCRRPCRPRDRHSLHESVDGAHGHARLRPLALIRMIEEIEALVPAAYPKFASPSHKMRRVSTCGRIQQHSVQRPRARHGCVRASGVETVRVGWRHALPTGGKPRFTAWSTARSAKGARAYPRCQPRRPSLLMNPGMSSR